MNPYRDNSKMACGCPGDDPEATCYRCSRERAVRLAKAMAELMERVMRMDPLR